MKQFTGYLICFGFILYGCGSVSENKTTDPGEDENLTTTDETESAGDGTETTENREATDSELQPTESTDSTSEATDSADDSAILSDISSLKSAKVYDANDMFIGYVSGGI